MKKIFITAAAASLVACAFCLARTVSEGRFNISGTVTVPERLASMAQADNNSCAIIVKNEADVPVAIKRVVNPKFPLAFTMGEEDLFRIRKGPYQKGLFLCAGKFNLLFKETPQVSVIYPTFANAVFGLFGFIGHLNPFAFFSQVFKRITFGYRANDIGRGGGVLADV